MADDYSTLRARIEDELNNTAIATDSRVNNAILSAIAYYEKERWWFTEGRTNTFTTVASQELYSSSDASWIANVVDVDDLTITVSGYRYHLEARTWDWIDEHAVTTTFTGQPTDYCYYAQQFRLYPIPDDAYTVRFSGAVPLTALSADGDSNAWTTVALAEGLIRSRAKREILERYFEAGDPGSADMLATVMRQEGEELQRLREMNDRRMHSGRIIPQDF